MKILIAVLLVLGCVLCFGSAKIAPKVFRRDGITDQDKVIIKTAGLVLVVIAAVITFTL